MLIKQVTTTLVAIFVVIVFSNICYANEDCIAPSQCLAQQVQDLQYQVQDLQKQMGKLIEINKKQQFKLNTLQKIIKQIKPDLFIKNYYHTIIYERDYKKALSMQSYTLRNKFAADFSWWDKIEHVAILKLEVKEHYFDIAKVEVTLRYFYYDEKKSVESYIFHLVTNNKNSWLIDSVKTMKKKPPMKKPQR